MGRKALSKKRKQNNSEKKQIWIEQLFDFFQEFGISAVKTNQIAAFLGKSKSTLYEYFKSKEEILNEVLAMKINRFIGYKEILERESEDYVKRYQNFMEFMCNESANLSLIFLEDLKVDFPKQWSIVNNFLELMLADLHHYYQKGIERNEFSRISIPLLKSQDEHFIFSILTNPEFLKQQELSIKELVEQYLQLKLNGLVMVNK